MARIALEPSVSITFFRAPPWMPPGVGMVAVMHQGDSFGRTIRAAMLLVSMRPSAYRPETLGEAALVGNAHQHLNLARGRVGGGIDAFDGAGKIPGRHSR